MRRLLAGAMTLALAATAAAAAGKRTPRRMLRTLQRTPGLARVGQGGVGLRGGLSLQLTASLSPARRGLWHEWNLIESHGMRSVRAHTLGADLARVYARALTRRIRVPT